jgi:hypothetical protein
MKITKGTFRIRQGVDGCREWHNKEGSYGHDFPFYVHRETENKRWTLSHMATGFAVKQNITLAQARRLSKALKSFKIFLMPTVETLQRQKSLLPTHKQTLLLNTIATNGEPNEQ